MPDVIVDQAHNILDFTTDIGIVYHVSANAPGLAERFLPAMDKWVREGRVLVNPRSIKTTLINVLETHVENFHYLEEIAHPFEYFCMEASNDMLIRKHVDQWIARHDAGLKYTEYDTSKNDWFLPMIREDRQLLALLKSYGIRHDTIVGYQIEGSFYRRDLLTETMHAMKRGYTDYHACNYSKEEVMLPTLFCRLNDVSKLRIARPYVFTPWGRKPTLWKLLKTRARRDYDVTVDDIQKIFAGKHPMRADCASIYGVKRIPRIIDAPMRIYVNQLMAQASDPTAVGTCVNRQYTPEGSNL